MERYPKEVYNSEEKYFANIALAYRTELEILQAAGVRKVRIDDPNFACKSFACPKGTHLD